MEEKADFIVPGNLMEGVLNYLASRPLGEVLGLFEEIRNCKPIPAKAILDPDPRERANN